MTLATNDEEIVDAEVVEDFNVDDVLKPRPVREVEVYVEGSLERAVRLTREAWARKDAAAVEVAAGIACMVKRGAGQGTSRSQDREVEVSVIEASRRLRKAEKTIRAYLDAWDRLAANGLCAPSTELTPDDLDSLVLPSAEDWQAEWQGNSHSRPTKTEPTVSERDWPVVPEPTPEELFQRLEKVRAQNIADGISKPPRTREEREADGRAFVESLIGKAERQAEPATPEDKFAKALNAVGAAIRVNHGVNEAALNEDGWNVLRALGLR